MIFCYQGLARDTEASEYLVKEERLVPWAAPSLPPASRGGALTLPAITVFLGSVRAMPVPRISDGSLSLSHHSLNTQACDSKWKAEGKE